MIKHKAQFSNSLVYISSLPSALLTGLQPIHTILPLAETEVLGARKGVMVSELVQ